jgi:hypothetical protein
VLPGKTWDASLTEQHVLLRQPPADDEEVKVADHALDAFTDEEFVFGRNEPGFSTSIGQSLR